MNEFKITMNDGSQATLVETTGAKELRHPDYKFFFDKKNGLFCRWGQTTKDDGDEYLGLPEIADIEISTVCHGPKGTPCPFCYKSNSGRGENMSFELFKQTFHKLPPSVTQIAFGIGDIDGNPDMVKIFEYTRAHGVIPNVTINGGRMTPYWFDWLASTCGAVAVSLYDEDLTYDAVKELTDRGMTQVNIHFMLAEETGNKFMQHLAAVRDDPRLAKLNATVILSLKQKGRGHGFKRINKSFFNALIGLMIREGVRFGFDSCSAGKVEHALSGLHDMGEITTEDWGKMKMMVEPCESTIYSAYINEKGEFFPCSFMEGERGWRGGLKVAETDDFLRYIWNAPKTQEFRRRAIDCRRNCFGCVHYDV